MKRLSALLLVFALVIANIPVAYASNVEATTRVECAEIDGEIYTYETVSDSNGNTRVSISDEDGNMQILVYSESNGVFYLDGEVVATTTKLVTAGDSGAIATASNWVYQGDSSDYVTWGTGVTVAVLAAIIAVPLGKVGAVGVIASMGNAALTALATTAAGGTVHSFVYLCDIGTTIETRVDWYFTASTGDRYPSSGKYTRFY